MWNNSKKFRSGFTLLEIMIALAVVSISFVVLLGLRNRDIALASYSRHITVSTLLARQKITEVSVEGFPDLGFSEGGFGETYLEFKWRQEVKQTPFEMVRELDLSVVWKEGKREEVSRFTVYLFDA
ncbi:MAG: prepilin-type N-terminal cleavage/methylation domain-containing protein [Nitrospira sp.]|nr:prepilin-type N-terminal cleavage/methylation domain-containing protein [Candidatus Manganitrophaceae bacterium]HIL35382.1 prepilin-type N-terminal cleavage/methylation domain-containing protein [Candidatus Manganitrophaceae bacterium]